MKDGMYNLLEWLGLWRYQYRQWGGHMLIVSFLNNLIVQPLQKEIQYCITRLCLNLLSVI